ncbi:MAG: serine hydrolase [Haliscomenobacter sp.]|nr:serine hydrolase [Haliscomenobacter sp.]
MSGMPWSAFVKKRLFEPIGMTNTYSTFAESQVQTNRSTPHYRVKGSIVPIRDMAVDEVGAAGSVWSSVED